jgi:predicted RNase H-like HicB family nuclease
MFASDLKALQESYQEMYEEGDGISCEMLEEVVEELIDECVEFGYSLNEAADAVQEAAILYIDEAKVTYGSDTESPEQRRERAKAKVGEKKAAARKAAVKTAVGRAKAKAVGAAASASIAGSIAKDTARRAARTAVHKVKYGAEKKKEQVKSGVKSLIGRGLRKAAGAVGKVASKAASAATKLGEQNQGPSTPVKFDSHMGQLVPNQGAGRVGAVRLKPAMGLKKGGTVKESQQLHEKPGDGYIGPTPIPNPIRLAKDAVDATNRASQKRVDAVNSVLPGSASMPKNVTYFNKGPSDASKKYLGLKDSYSPEDIYDVILEYLMSDGHADTLEEAHYVMSQLTPEHIQSIVEGVMPEPINPAAHKAAQKTQKIYNLGKGTNNPNEAQSALKRTGPQLPGV